MRCMTPINPKDCIIGQYVADGKGATGYLEDPTVPPGSK